MLRVLGILAKSRDQQSWKWAGGGLARMLQLWGAYKVSDCTHTYAQHHATQERKAAAYKTRIEARRLPLLITVVVLPTLQPGNPFAASIVLCYKVPVLPLSLCDMIPLSQSAREWRVWDRDPRAPRRCAQVDRSSCRDGP